MARRDAGMIPAAMCPRPSSRAGCLRSALGTVGGSWRPSHTLPPVTTDAIDSLPSGSHLLCVDESATPYKLAIPSLAREPMPGTFNGVTLQSKGRVTRDGREFVYLEPSVTSRLLLIENLK
jgi:hypothetical protein